jgi:hypothetical protein
MDSDLINTMYLILTANAPAFLCLLADDPDKTYIHE